uniref:Uncharacterized protein n=1 Tax=Panagrolaimus superbus TaxID=310955 RepID=A0A914YW49_9BILA
MQRIVPEILQKVSLNLDLTTHQWQYGRINEKYEITVRTNSTRGVCVFIEFPFELMIKSNNRIITSTRDPTVTVSKDNAVILEVNF